MPLRTLILFLLLAVIALFTALNWSAFMAPTTLSLAFATVQAPLGLIMLGVTAILGTLFLLYLVYIQGTVILDARRAARDLHAQRELADQAEASRFTALQAFLRRACRSSRRDSSQRRLAPTVSSVPPSSARRTRSPPTSVKRRTASSGACRRPDGRETASDMTPVGLPSPGTNAARGSTLATGTAFQSMRADETGCVNSGSSCGRACGSSRH